MCSAASISVVINFNPDGIFYNGSHASEFIRYLYKSTSREASAHAAPYNGRERLQLLVGSF